MNKRGQITLFIILGILIVAAVILVLYLRGQLFFGPVTSDNLNTKMVPIKDHIIQCMQEVSPQYIEKIGLQGGYLSTPTDTYRMWDNETVSYLCYNMKKQPTCYNRMLTKAHMEQELEQVLELGLLQCIDLSKFEGKGYDLVYGKRKITLEIGEDKIIINIKMPITIKKDDVSITEQDFTANFNYPLGRLYNTAQDVIDIESQYGEFDQLTYMLMKKGQFIIDKQRPYPDKLYILKTKDNPYTFQFFIQGEPT
jgi:hypothetical protein